jgi:hypothetical protein
MPNRWEFVWLAVLEFARFYLSNIPGILGFHYGIMQWVWRGVNLKCIDAYVVLEWENDMKFCVFATKHKANT